MGTFLRIAFGLILLLYTPIAMFRASHWLGAHGGRVVVPSLAPGALRADLGAVSAALLGSMSWHDYVQGAALALLAWALGAAAFWVLQKGLGGRGA